MAKIILTMNDEVLREVALSKERITIGRAPHNDLVIDNRAVSAEHAVIVTVGDDWFLEDLNSTNGTQVNGQPIKKHFLQENDVIELAQYRLRYIVESDRNSPSPSCDDDGVATDNTGKSASIRFLNGPSAGKESIIVKSLTTIGRSDMQVAVISRRAAGYFIAHVEGAGAILVNDRAIGTSAQALENGDVIHLGGIQMQFFLH